MRQSVAGLLLLLCGSSWAFQIGPVGPRQEARLTNEKEPALFRFAGRLGRLIKSPVHEEITQIAFDCPAELGSLEGDQTCASSDRDFADAFTMHGVRWNDMPPFRLNPGQGMRCKKAILGTPACTVEQTVRFSTQPECWLCLFNEAETIAQSKRITGCQKGEEFVPGNLMTRSHFGDLQFLHAMADATGIPAATTRSKVLDWAQFAWRVADGDFGVDHKLREIDIPTIQEHFGCSEWTVSDIYVLGAKETMNRRIRDIAFGSILHTVQDSFAAGHAEREPPELGGRCSGSAPKPGATREFHAYAAQDGHKHEQAQRPPLRGRTSRGTDRFTGRPARSLVNVW